MSPIRCLVDIASLFKTCRVDKMSFGRMVFGPNAWSLERDAFWQNLWSNRHFGGQTGNFKKIFDNKNRFFYHFNGTTTLGIAALRIVTLSITTLSINDTQHDNVNLKAVINFKLGCFCCGCNCVKYTHMPTPRVENSAQVTSCLAILSLNSLRFRAPVSSCF